MHLGLAQYYIVSKVVCLFVGGRRPKEKRSLALPFPARRKNDDRIYIL